MILTAHSGCDETPMNSVEYLRYAAGLPVDAVEIDIRRSAQGELVLTHNQPVGGEVTLRECLTILLPCGKMINADLKEKGLEGDVLKTAAEVGFSPERIVFTGSIGEATSMLTRVAPADVFFNPEEEDPAFYATLKAMSEPEMEKYLLVVLGKIAMYGFKVVNVNYRCLTPTFLACCEKYGLAISAWTVNDLETMQQLKTIPAWNITSRKPGLFAGL